MSYRFKDKTIDFIRNFNEKYNVIIDMDALEDMYESLSKHIQNAQKSTKAKNFAEKNKNVREAEKSFKDGYKDLFSESLNDRVKIENANGYDENINLGSFMRDFNSLMINIARSETTLFKYSQYSSLTYGGMSTKELEEATSNIGLNTQSKEILSGFKGKSVSQIDAEFREKYINNKEPYDTCISAAQAIKEKNDSRGFFGRLFHPFDSRKEKKLFQDLANKMKKEYPDKNFDADVVRAKHYSNDSLENQIEINEVIDEVGNIIEDPASYNESMVQEAREKGLSGDKTPEDFRREAEEKYKKKIYPTFKEAFDNGDIKDAKEFLGDDYGRYKDRFEREMKELIEGKKNIKGEPIEVKEASNIDENLNINDEIERMESEASIDGRGMSK